MAWSKAFSSVITVGFISCIFGVGDVGWAFITYGVCDAIASLMFGYVVKYTGRISIYLLGAAINLVVIITMFTYPPDHESTYFLSSRGCGVLQMEYGNHKLQVYSVLL